MWRTHRVVALLAASGLGCSAILGLESSIETLPPADAGAPADDRQTFCERLSSPANAPVLACNDFDGLDPNDAGKFGFNGGILAPTPELRLEVERARVFSPPNALAVHVTPATRPTLVNGEIDIDRPPDRLRTQFDVSYGPDEGVADAASGLVDGRTILLVVVNVDDVGENLILFGINQTGTLADGGADRRNYFVTHTKFSEVTKNPLLLDDSERLAAIDAPSEVYTRFVLSVEHRACSGASGGLAVFLSSASPDDAPATPGNHLLCKDLPPSIVALPAKTKISVGGQITKPVVSTSWRFDNLVVRGVE